MQVEQVLFSRDHGADVPLDLVAVDLMPGRISQLHWHASNVIDTTNTWVNNDDAVEKQADGMELVWHDGATTEEAAAPESAISG